MTGARRAGLALYAAGVTALATLAACDTGVVIVVRTTAMAPADTVELFLAHEQVCGPSEPMPCAIQPPGARSRLPGFIYTRDEVPSFTQAVGADGVARFRIEPGAVDALVPLFVAVGTTAGIPTSAMLVARGEPIDAAGPLKLVVDLAPADGSLDAPAVGPARTVDHVQLWTQPDAPHSTCLAFEHDGDGDVVRKFIVPADDPDCDSVTTLEKPDCERVAGAGTVGTTLPDAATCVGTVLDEPGKGACALGARSCEQDANKSCVGGQLCVPRDVCSRCGDATSLDAAAKCLIGDGTVGTGSPTRLVCAAHFEAVPNTIGQVDHYVACASEPYSLQLSGFTNGCEAPRFGHLAPDGSLVTSAGAVEITPPATELEGLTLRAQVTSGGDGCDIDLKLDGAISHELRPLPTVVMRVDPTNPATHGIAFPLAVKASILDGCSGPTRVECTWTTVADPMFSCPQ